MVKKTVVVGTGKKDIVLRGEELEVINKDLEKYAGAPPYLVVTVRENGKRKTIAMFKEWKYWEEKTLEIQKITEEDIANLVHDLKLVHDQMVNAKIKTLAIIQSLITKWSHITE